MYDISDRQLVAEYEQRARLPLILAATGLGGLVVLLLFLMLWS